MSAGPVAQGGRWAPLEGALAVAECGDYMFMGCGQVDGQVLWLYKHIDTRRYLNLSADGRAWKYAGGEYRRCTMDDGQYVELPLSEALAWVRS